MDKFVMKLSDDGVYLSVGTVSELANALRTCPVACVKFHMRYGLNDFAEWAGKSLKNEDLTLKLRQVKLTEANPESTRRMLLDVLTAKPAPSFKGRR
ncbi:MAG: hypothetical protein V1703_01130 [Candidatus Altiarchaeota archaeon]